MASATSGSSSLISSTANFHVTGEIGNWRVWTFVRFDYPSYSNCKCSQTTLIHRVGQAFWVKQEYTLYLFIYFFDIYSFFWETVGAGTGQRERETQNPKQAPGSELSAQSLTRGLELTNCGIMIWAEVGHLTDWATRCPRALLLSPSCSFSSSMNYTSNQGLWQVVIYTALCNVHLKFYTLLSFYNQMMKTNCIEVFGRNPHSLTMGK